MFGLTFDGTENLDAIEAYLLKFKKRPTIRLICDEPGSGFTFAQLVEPCLRLSPIADIMITVCDSYFMKKLNVGAYERRVQRVCETYGDLIKYVEIGNEIGGNWLGSTKTVYAKVLAAKGVVDRFNLKSAVTWYLDADEPERLWNQIAAMPKIKAHLQLISWYPNYNPSYHPNWKEVFNWLGNAFPNSFLGFGEFGVQPLTGKGQIPKVELIKQIMLIDPLHPNFVGGYFYWDTNEAVKGNETSVLDALLDTVPLTTVLP